MEGKLSTNKIGTNLGRGSSAQQLSTRVNGVVHNGSGWEGGGNCQGGEKKAHVCLDGWRTKISLVHSCMLPAYTDITHSMYTAFQFTQCVSLQQLMDRKPLNSRAYMTSIKHYCLTVTKKTHAWMFVCVCVWVCSQPTQPNPLCMTAWPLIPPQLICFLDQYKQINH